MQYTHSKPFHNGKWLTAQRGVDGGRGVYLEPGADMLCDVILADLQHDVLPGALPDVHQHVCIAVLGQLQGGGGEAWGRGWGLILTPKLLIERPLAGLLVHLRAAEAVK